MIENFLRENPQLRMNLRTFEGFREAARSMWPAIIVKVTGPLEPLYLERVFDRPDEFPVLNTWLNCQLHLSFLSTFSDESPSPGRIDDYRNIIESNAADLFVTADTRLLRTYPTLNPFRRVSLWESFAARLHTGAGTRE